MVQFALVKLWPLLAATAAMDACAAMWWMTSSPERANNRFLVAILTALTLSQVAVVAIWLAFRRVHDRWSYTVPTVALAVAAMVRLKLSTFDDYTVKDYACRTAVQMLGTLFGIWLLRWTIWRPTASHSTFEKWEFSVRQMLLWMTLSACFFGLVARSTWSNGEFMPLIMLSGVFAPPTVAVSVVVVARYLSQWYLRLCAYIAIGTTVAAYLAYGRSYIFSQLIVEFILEALVVAAWVEWSGIVPWRKHQIA